MKNLDYSSTNTPRKYKCTVCGVAKCKLWREYNSFGPIHLECVDCAIESQNKPNIAPSFARSAAKVGFAVAEDGMYDCDGQRTDSIGWRVPAVPTEDNYTYWGYTSVPQEGVEWWKRLPLRPLKKKKK